MEKKCLAYSYAMKHFRQFLLRKKFTLISDNEPLHYMHSRSNPGQQLTRWMFRFLDFENDF